MVDRTSRLLILEDLVTRHSFCIPFSKFWLYTVYLIHHHKISQDITRTLAIRIDSMKIGWMLGNPYGDTNIFGHGVIPSRLRQTWEPWRRRHPICRRNTWHVGFACCQDRELVGCEQIHKNTCLDQIHQKTASWQQYKYLTSFGICWHTVNLTPFWSLPLWLEQLLGSEAATLFKLCKDLDARDIMPAIFFNFSRSGTLFFSDGSMDWSLSDELLLVLAVLGFVEKKQRLIHNHRVIGTRQGRINHFPVCFKLGMVFVRLKEWLKWLVFFSRKEIEKMLQRLVDELEKRQYDKWPEQIRSRSGRAMSDSHVMVDQWW